MKNIAIALYCLLCSVFVLGQSNEKTEIRKLEPFEKIRVSKGINVTLREGADPEAEITIVNANLDDVIIQQKGGEVTIRMKTKIYRNVSVNVWVTFQNLTEIAASTGGSINSEDIIEAEFLTIEAGMDAAIELEVEVKRLKVVASTARVEVSGKADRIDVNASSGGKYLGFELECNNAKVRSVTGGLALVNVTENLDAYAATSGTIRHKGGALNVEVVALLGGQVLEEGADTEDDDDDDDDE